MVTSVLYQVTVVPAFTVSTLGLKSLVEVCPFGRIPEPGRILTCAVKDVAIERADATGFGTGTAAGVFVAAGTTGAVATGRALQHGVAVELGCAALVADDTAGGDGTGFGAGDAAAAGVVGALER